MIGDIKMTFDGHFMNCLMSRRGTLQVNDKDSRVVNFERDLDVAVVRASPGFLVAPETLPGEGENDKIAPSIIKHLTFF